MKKMTQEPNKTVQRITVFAVVIVFLLVPFTTPIAVMLGSHLEHLWLFQAWKEILILVIGLLVLCAYPIHHFLAKTDSKIKIVAWLMFAYAAWTILWGFCNLLIFDRVNEQAFAYSLAVNLRFFFFFLLCLVVATYSPILIKQWWTFLLAPAALVIGFAMLQLFVLPADFLKHLGYGPDTIPTHQLVDQKDEYVRLQSTLRGPNPLGVYLILIIAALVAGLRTARHRWLRIVMIAGAAITIFYTYSRSAWLGLIATLGVLFYIGIVSARLRRITLGVGAAIVVLIVGGVYFAKDSNLVQNTLFHTDETSLSAESANAERTRALKQGASDVLHEPLGRGPGTAGPASIHNDQPERIAENYYLQIGQEVGWIGLGLFVAINVAVAVLLRERHKHVLAAVLFAALIGISIANFVSHAWTDETIALLWWGLAGIALAFPKNKTIAS